MSIGKDLRLRRIIDPISGTTLMFAFSHGTSVPTVLEGIEHPAERLRAVRDGGADCIFLTPGLLQTLSPVIAESHERGVVAKVTATATRGERRNQERAIVSVEACAELGVDGIVALLPFAPENEPDMITLAGALGEQCRKFGLPFIAEAEFPNAYYEGDEDYAKTWGLPYLRRSARLCVELGADVVKSNWPGSREQFAEIVDCVPVPVVVAGGSRSSDLDLLNKVLDAKLAGAVGTSVGRNIFQHADPAAITRAIRSVLRGECSPTDAVAQHLSTTTELAAAGVS
jgi:DhnA family fructose-bisphosphate aldolase class Ia